jgi:hypothetical protein
MRMEAAAAWRGAANIFRKANGGPVPSIGIRGIRLFFASAWGADIRVDLFLWFGE